MPPIPPRDMPMSPHDRGPRERNQLRPWAIVAVTLGLLLGFLAVAALVALGDTTAFDVRVTLELQQFRTPLVYWVMYAISWPGFIPRNLVIGVAMLIVLLAKRRLLEARCVGIAFLLAALDQPLKLLSHRARPVAGVGGIDVVGHVTGFSFPSGHVLSYTLVLGLLAYFATDLPRRTRTATWAFLLMAIVLVGPSRLYLGQHWFSDVLASYLLGLGLLTPLLVYYERARRRHRDETSPTGQGAARPESGA